MRSQSSKPLPLPVKRTLRKLGADLVDARKRRRISTSTMAQRAMISSTTFHSPGRAQSIMRCIRDVGQPVSHSQDENCFRASDHVLTDTDTDEDLKEINRMATAFEHDEMMRAQKFCAA